MDSDPRPIPAIVAYRLCAAVLETAARRLQHKAEATRQRRPGHAAGSERKQAGRDAAARELLADAARLHHLAAQSAGAGADAAALGYLLAWLADCGELWPELAAECESLGVSLPASKDRVGVCRAVIGGRDG
jgi:hypothetical protein